MALTLAQRLERVRVRSEELTWWIAQDRVPLTGWTFNGTEIAAGAHWPVLAGVQRIAAQGRVPDNWDIQTTELWVDVGGESLLTIESGGQTHRFGLDPYHTEFPVHGREVVLVAEAVNRLPFGEPIREPRLKGGDLVLVNAEVNELRTLMRQVVEACEALGTHEAVDPMLCVAEAALRGLDWPSETTDHVRRIAGNAMQMTIWAYPEIEGGLRPMTPAQRASVTDGLAQAREGLARLRTLYPATGEVILTGHAHVDLAWLWPYAETCRKTRRTFNTASQLLKDWPEFHFNQSTAAYYDQTERDDPALFQAICAHVAEGRWEPIGGMWVEPDTTMPTGESLVRQALYGQRYFERTFGARHTVCWLPDCFGFTPALPQILVGAGLTRFFTIKVNWSETNRFPHDLFWWEGLDGSRVLAHTFRNPEGGYNGIMGPKAVRATWDNFRGKRHHPATLLSIGHGDGGGGVTPDMLLRTRQFNDLPGMPKVRWAKVADHFAAIEANPEVDDLPTWVGEIYLELHRGTFTTQGNIKRMNRQAEAGLIVAEVVSALLMLKDGTEAPSLEPAWRMLLKNQFHDILPGSSIAEVYVDAKAELNEVIATAASRTLQDLKALADGWTKGGGADAVLAANPSTWPRPLRLTLPDGQEIVSADKIAPLSVAVVDPTRLTPEAPVVASDRHLENALIRVEIGAQGQIARILHKPTGRDALQGQGSRLVAQVQDKPRNWDAWDVEDDTHLSMVELGDPEAISLTRATPDLAEITVTHRFRHSTITQQIRLRAGSGRVDVATRLDWHDRHVMIRAIVPTTVRAQHATSETAFGVQERPTRANTSWDEARFEFPAHRFVDISEPAFGVALLNDGRYGHSVRSSELGISLLRSPVYPDPFADEGESEVVWSIFVHSGDWRQGGVLQEAEDLNRPLPAIDAPGCATGAFSPVGLDGLQMALACFKRAEDDHDLILRLYEPFGDSGILGLTVPHSTVDSTVNLLEDSLPAGADALVRPFEIRSIRLNHYANTTS